MLFLNVIGVRFSYTKRIKYYSFENIVCSKENNVICNTEYGLQLGEIVTDSIDVDPNKINYNIEKIIRIANENDKKNYEKNEKDAKKALIKAKELVKKHNLDMTIIDTLYTFDREQLIFFFVADSRIDFRDLARELASIYKTRIELRQVGVRDKAACVGGIGICGGELCCARFLKEFDSVSINMAKNQNIALNPTKINGVCGRLLCCLKYEDDVYLEKRKGLPNVGKLYETDKGVGKVISVDILSRTFKVDVNGNIIEVNLNENNK